MCLRVYLNSERRMSSLLIQKIKYFLFFYLVREKLWVRKTLPQFFFSFVRYCVLCITIEALDFLDSYEYSGERTSFFSYSLKKWLKRRDKFTTALMLALLKYLLKSLIPFQQHYISKKFVKLPRKLVVIILYRKLSFQASSFFSQYNVVDMVLSHLETRLAWV